jgi:hypothetical protein
VDKLGMEVIYEPPLVVETEKPKIIIQNNLKEVYTSSMIWMKDDKIGGDVQELFPLGITNNQFEYFLDSDFHRMNLNTLIDQTIPYTISDPLGELVEIDSNNLYYFESTELKGKNHYNIICRRRESFDLVWKTNIYDKGGLTNLRNRIYQNDQYLFVTLSENYTLLCLNKVTGKIVWTFDASKLIKNISYRTETDCIATMGNKFLTCEELSKEGIILNLHTEDNAPNDRPTVDEYFFVSYDGKLINTLGEKPLFYFENSYFYKKQSLLAAIGYKSLANNLNVWQRTIIDQNQESDFQQIGSYLIQSKKDLQGLHLTFYDQKDGSIKWYKTLRSTEIFTINEWKGVFYIFYEDYKKYENYYILTWDSSSNQENEITLLNKIDKKIAVQVPYEIMPTSFSEFLIKFSMIRASDNKINILLGAGWLTIQDRYAVYHYYQKFIPISRVASFSNDVFHVLTFYQRNYRNNDPAWGMVVLKDVTK